MFHIQSNINCEKCIVVVITTFSQLTPVLVPKSFKNAPAQVLS